MYVTCDLEALRETRHVLVPPLGEKVLLDHISRFCTTLQLRTASLLDIKVTKKQVRQCTFKRNNGAGSSNHCCSGKAINVAYSECASVFLP
jgi:hypothetical protein